MSDPEAPRQSSFRQTLSAVAWSFFGVRKGRDMRRDALAVRPVHVIVIGVGLAAAFVLTLILVVRFVVS